MIPNRKRGTICIVFLHLIVKWSKLDGLNWLIVFVVWLTDEKRLALFPFGTIVRDPHHRESPKSREQDLSVKLQALKCKWKPYLAKWKIKMEEDCRRKNQLANLFTLSCFTYSLLKAFLLNEPKGLFLKAPCRLVWIKTIDFWCFLKNNSLI